jgi:hypothetical protein
MPVTREEMMIVFGVDQSQLDNALRMMPVKMSGAAKRSVSVFEQEFKALGKKLSSGLSEAFIGAFSGAAVGSKIVGAIGSGLKFLKDRAEFSDVRGGEVRRGQLRTGLDSGEFQRADNVFQKMLGGGMEQALDRLADAVAKAKEGDEAGLKLADALIELGASLETIRSGDFRRVFFQIADNMKTAEQSAEKIAALGDIFGRAGGELILPFRKGMDSLAANTGMVDESDVKRAKLQKELSEQSAFMFSDVGRTAGEVVKAPWTFLKIFAKEVGGLFGLIPEKSELNADDVKFLADERARKARERLNIEAEAAEKKKQADKEAKENAETLEQAQKLEIENFDRAFKLRQKTLTLEQQIAKAKEQQAAAEARVTEIQKKSPNLEKRTAKEKLAIEEGARDALKAREEAEQKQRELDAKKKEAQERVDEAQKRIQKAETEVARTEAERYGFTIAQLAGGEGEDIVSGMRGRNARRMARRALSRLSPAEAYDVAASQEIEAARQWAKAMTGYGQFEDARAALQYADSIAETLNFAKPSEYEWQRQSLEALQDSRDAMQKLLKAAQEEGIVIIPRMGE